MTTIISAFPATGKSFLYKEFPNKFFDSDSSNFSQLDTNKKNPDFPNNYICYIKKKLSEKKIILVSSHEIVRKALVENNLRFTLIYPDITLKQEYLIRCKLRKSPESFIEMLDKNWNNFINSCQNQKNCTKIVLQKYLYLKDVFHYCNTLQETSEEAQQEYF